jgi:hypothetical protein
VRALWHRFYHLRSNPRNQISEEEEEGNEEDEDDEVESA